jgi:ATP-dependent Lon protease
MLRSGACANPVVLLDEIDKFSAGKSESGGDAYAALYQLLEPENSKAFTDRYLLFPIDCSYINWILTANEVTEIPDPIRKRVRQFTIRRPTGQEMVDLVIPSVYREVIKDGNLCDAVDHSLSSVVMEVLAKLHTPREVRQALAESLGKAALRNRSTGDTGALLTLAVEDFAKIPSKERQRIGF